MGKLRLREVNDQRWQLVFRTGTQISIFSFQDLCLFHLYTAQFFEAVVTTEGWAHFGGTGTIHCGTGKNALELLFLIYF